MQCAVGGDLDDVAAIHDVHDAKASADDESALEQRFDLLGRGIGGDVEVFGLEAQQQVAHRAADDVGLETRLLQGLHGVAGVLRKAAGVDLVLGAGQVAALATVLRVGFGFVRGEQATDEFTDHVNN